MSSEHFALIGKAVNDEVSRGQLPDAAVAVARRGKLYFPAFSTAVIGSVVVPPSSHN